MAKATNNPNPPTKGIIDDPELGVTLMAQAGNLPMFDEENDKVPHHTQPIQQVNIEVSLVYPRNNRPVSGSKKVRFQCQIIKPGKTANHARDAVAKAVADALGVELDPRMSALNDIDPEVSPPPKRQ